MKSGRKEDGSPREVKTVKNKLVASLNMEIQILMDIENQIGHTFERLS